MGDRPPTLTNRRLHSQANTDFENDLPGLFENLFSSLLAMGIAAVKGAKLKDNDWIAKLEDLAKKTWSGLWKF